ncbi:condensation domain-containing protein [Micromonospora sp. NPDC048999]|uniref:condensation domain-containing protein n=1 Tax=Micromonospora sp. NPDC048999 TaxID=3155391 RepID=UPI0033F078AD
MVTVDGPDNPRVVAKPWWNAERQALLDQLREARPPDDRIAARPRHGRPALSLAQERLWFVDAVARGTGVNTVSGGLWLRGELDRAGLHRAVRGIVARHEVLRTTVHVDGDGRLGGLLTDPAVPLPVLEADGPAEAVRAAKDLASARLDLTAGPLLRATLLRVAPEEHLLVLTAHHAAVDRVSLEIMVRELVAGYVAPGSVEPPPVQYADYAAWQRRRFASGALAAQVDHWLDRLRGARVLDLAPECPRPARRSYAGAVVEHAVAPGAAARLAALGREHRATPLMVAIAVWALALSRLADRPDVVIGTPFGGRDRMELHRLVGCFVNLLPLRIDLAGAGSFGALLDHVRDVMVAAAANAEAPFDAMVRGLRLPRDPGGDVPLIRHVVQQAEPMPRVQAGSLELVPQDIDIVVARFDLTVFARTSGRDGLDFRIVYATEVLDAAAVRRVVSEVDRVCAEVAGEPVRSFSV